jgi:ParB family chromosome partitioning protein
VSRKPSPMDPFLARALSALEEMERKPVQAGGKVLPLEALVPSPQPRRRFENLEALAESIREKGVLQPLLVRPLGDGRYAIVAGERRYRAAKMAGLAEVPVRVLDLSEKEARLLALVENLQREDLNPYEETLGVLDLLSEELGKTREEVVALLHRMRDEKRGEFPTTLWASPRPSGWRRSSGPGEDDLGVLRTTPPPPPRAPRGPEGGPGGGRPPLHRRPGAQEGEGP